MTFNDDPDLETRLRRIAAGPKPDVPASVYSRLDEVVHGSGARSINGVRLSPVRLSGRGRPGLRQAGALAALAAVLVIAVSAAALLVAPRGPQAASTWTLRPDAGQGEWTGLEWHDITATAEGIGMATQWYGWRYSSSWVVWRGGFAMVGGNMDVWVSKDGLTWKQSTGAPRYAGLVAVGGDLLAWGPAINGSDSGLWLTTDAVKWTRVSVPFNLTSVSGLAGSSPGLVIVTTTLNSSDPRGPSAIFFSADAKTWTQATLPDDLSQAGNVNISPFGRGFVAIGLVSDPNGSTTYSSGAGDERHYSYRAWISHDGLTWTSYDPAVPGTGVSSNTLPWTGMQWGRLGAGDALIHSTDGGVTWLADSDGIPNWLGGETVSDGNRIIMAAGSGARFYLSEGDGHWRLLQQGGDVGSLPADGQVLLLPNGVLWIAGDRVYFGQALSGIEPQGSLGPPTTASPGPTLPYPTSTPAVLATETTVVTPTPEPTPTAINASAFTTPGALSGWTGFSWKSGQTPSDNPVNRVIRWSGGYVATNSTINPARSLWVSSDGETWTPVTSLPAAWFEVAAAPGGLVAMALDYGSGSESEGRSSPVPSPSAPSATVWTSSDGLTWHNAGKPDLLGVPTSMAGTDTGIVATVEVQGADNSGAGTAEVEFSTDGVHWSQETVEPGLDWSVGPFVQSNAGRFFLMGGTTTPLAKAGDEPHIVFAAIGTHSYVWWSDDGRTWTRSGSLIGGFGMSIDFGRDGMLLNVDYGTTPGGVGLEISKDGGKTWAPDSNFGPLGQAACSGECSISADGVIGANGTVFAAVKNGGKNAWLSYDGQTWTPITWSGGDPSAASSNGFGGFTVLPRGVMLTGVYGAAH